MDIGTAKATAAERAAVPHHGLDLVDPDERFTAADYRRHALAALGGIAARGGIALLVGGTGLYLRAVARGLPLDQGDSDAAVRASLEARLAEDGLAPLVAELRARDPEGAGRIDERNPRRVVRALERTVITGMASPAPPLGYGGPSIWLGLAREPEDHRRAIEERARAQFAGGLARRGRAVAGALSGGPAPPSAPWATGRPSTCWPGTLTSSRPSRRTPGARGPTRVASAPGSVPSPASPGSPWGRGSSTALSPHSPGSLRSGNVRNMS